MKKNMLFFFLFVFFATKVIVSQEISDKKKIDDFDRYRYELILNRKACNFDFFEEEKNAIAYANFLFNQDKYTDKEKKYDYRAYDAGEDWMIYIIEKKTQENEGDYYIDTLDGLNEYIVIFRKKTGEVIRFERYIS